MRVSKSKQERVLLERLVVELHSQVDRPILDGLFEHVRQGDQMLVNPGFEVGAAGNGCLQFSVVDNAASDGVDEKHAAGLQATLLNNTILVDGDCSNL